MSLVCPKCQLRIEGGDIAERQERFDHHLQLDHPQYEVRILNADGETMSHLGYFEGNAPAHVKKLDGKSLEKLDLDLDGYVFVRLRHYRAEHERKHARKVGEHDRHLGKNLFVSVTAG